MEKYGGEVHRFMGGEVRWFRGGLGVERYGGFRGGGTVGLGVEVQWV